MLQCPRKSVFSLLTSSVDVGDSAAVRLLLEYCLADVLDDDGESVRQLAYLPLLPLGDGSVGTIRLDASASPAGTPSLPYITTVSPLPNRNWLASTANM